MFQESPDQAWALRYGESGPALPALGRFLSHRSVRRFSDRPVPESVVSGLIAAAQSASTSSNLQLWSVVSVQEPELRRRIAVACADQKQVHKAPWFFAFLVDHHRLRSAAAEVGESALGLDYNEFYTMGLIDAALAAERMVCAAEWLGLGACYIGALRNDPYAVRELLGLPDGTFGAFGLCLGWPEEPSRAQIKPRLRQEAVWFRERYGAADVAEYDDRMAEFYASQGMAGEASWRLRSGKRVDERHLTGREVLKQFLAEQGMDLR